MLPFGIASGIVALAGALMLWFGRRLASYRERNGYVREEDQLDGPSELETSRVSAVTE